MKKKRPNFDEDNYEVSSDFRIRKIETKAGTRYQADLGRKSGKHVRKNFERIKDARRWAYDERVKRDNAGIRASNFSDNQKTDSIEALEILKPFGVNLRTAAHFYAKKNQEVTDENRFSTLAEQYLQNMKKRKLRPSTLTDAKTRLTRFSDAWGEMAIDSVEAKDIDGLMDEYSYEGANRDNYVRRLEAFYNWAIKEKKTKSNPVLQTDEITLNWEMPRIYKPAETTAILHNAESAHPKLVPYLAIAFFAGVRPEEISRLKWSDIDLSSSEIHIRGEQSKTRHARLVPISKNLKAWLIKYRNTSSEDKRILPASPATLAKWRTKVMTEAKIEMIQDGARHSFATYFYALHGISDTMNALGHSNPQMLKKHYEALIKNRKAQAKKFFEIMPSDGAKIIHLERTGTE